MKPLLIVIAGPSGVGKTVVSRKVFEMDPSVVDSVSCTTRKMKPGEQEGKDYHFLSREDFLAKVERGEFLEHAEVFGNLYGTLAATVTGAMKNGRSVLMVIDILGAANVRKFIEGLPDDDPIKESFVDIFLLPPNMDELRRRIGARQRETPEEIEERLRRAKKELSNAQLFQYCLVNEDVDKSAKTILAIMDRERRPKPDAKWKSLVKQSEEISRTMAIAHGMHDQDGRDRRALQNAFLMGAQVAKKAYCPSSAAFGPFPKKEGYYWWRETPSYSPSLVEVGKYSDGSGWWMRCFYQHEDSPHTVEGAGSRSQWIGPIYKPQDGPQDDPDD